jgi:hypothetical protein
LTLTLHHNQNIGSTTHFKFCNTMAEFPDMGAHCSVPECRQLGNISNVDFNLNKFSDLLPIKCDACSLILWLVNIFSYFILTHLKIFSKEHRNYQSHRCKEAYKKVRKNTVIYKIHMYSISLLLFRRHMSQYVLFVINQFQ